MTNLGNPGPVGLVAFGFTTVFLSLVLTGILPPGGESMVMPMAIMFGGTIQLIAGVLEFRVGNTFGMTAFLSYGAFWWWFALVFLFSHNGILDVSGAGVTAGACNILWGILTGAFWISTFRISWALSFTFLAAMLTFLLLGFGAVLASSGLTFLGGWVGLLTGILAFYTGIAVLTNGTYGREVMPLGILTR